MRDVWKEALMDRYEGLKQEWVEKVEEWKVDFFNQDLAREAEKLKAATEQARLKANEMGAKIGVDSSPFCELRCATIVPRETTGFRIGLLGDLYARLTFTHKVGRENMGG